MGFTDRVKKDSRCFLVRIHISAVCTSLHKHSNSSYNHFRMEMLNETETETNLTDQLDFTEYADIYKASGILHLLLVVIPVLTLGPLVVGLFASNKKFRDPASILFMCNTCVCILGPLTYGLLMDISLITDIPVLGSCEMFGGRIFWFQLVTYQLTLMVSNSITVVVQYITVRWGQKKLPIKLTVTLFFIVALLNFIVSFYNLQTEGTVPIRGSLCHETGSFLISGIITIFFILLPSAITVGMFSFLTVKYVKNNTIDNKKAVKDVGIIMVAMTISVIVFRFLPVVNFLAQSYGATEEVGAVVSWILEYSADFSYPLFLILTLLVHKGVRNTLVERLKSVSYASVKQRSNRVVPATSTTIKECKP